MGKNTKPINTITNKEVYWIFVNDIRKDSIVIDKLEQSLKFKDGNWDEIFMISHILKDTRIRAFQIKILYNLIPCNLYLRKISKSEMDKCTSCDKLDDPIHYFYECKQVTPLWNSFKLWWNRTTGENINLDPKSVIIGKVGDQKKLGTLNACILIAKWHIYKRKLDESIPFFYNFLRELKYYLKIEKTIALRNGRLEAYYQTWQIIEQNIT